MTGNELITEFDAVVANDLYPIGASSSAAKLVLLNIAARRIMHLLKIVVRSVPVTYSTGTTRYDLLTAPSVPLDEVNRLVYNDVDYPRSANEDDLGWSQVDTYIDVFAVITNAATFYLHGYQAPLAITASATAITDVPVDLHIALVQLAVVEGCVANEDDPAQLMRLQRLEQTALDKINRRVAKNASTAFAFINSRT